MAISSSRLTPTSTEVSARPHRLRAAPSQGRKLPPAGVKSLARPTSNPSRASIAGRVPDVSHRRVLTCRRGAIRPPGLTEKSTPAMSMPIPAKSARRSSKSWPSRWKLSWRSWNSGQRKILCRRKNRKRARRKVRIKQRKRRNRKKQIKKSPTRVPSNWYPCRWGCSECSIVERHQSYRSYFWVHFMQNPFPASSSKRIAFPQWGQ